MADISSRIEYGKTLFAGKNMMYFLYGVDFLSHPNRDEILEKVSQTGKKFKIQISLEQLSDTVQVLTEIYKKHWFFEVTVAQEVDNQAEIKDIFSSLKVFSKLTHIRFNYDVITDTSKQQDFVHKLIWLFGEYRKDPVHKHLSFPDLWNINLWIAERFYINAKTQQVDHLSYDHCVMDDLFDVQDDKIVFNDHVELDREGNLRLHTPLCFLSYIKIAHRDETPDDILNKFKKFKQDVSQVRWDMPKKCFACIKNNYPLS
jgi:hypothetical protein